MTTRVLLALSGGLDSAAAATILQKQGCYVQAIYINMHNRHNDIQQAKNVAKDINIPLQIIDANNEFNNSVLKYFKTQLNQGFTPAPCSFCNPNLKWRILFDYAVANNFDKIATGHYVRTVTVNDKIFIRKGVDPAKDQSYYLWDLPQEILNKTIFPLGEMTKMEVRKMLGDKGFTQLSTASESMSLCFIDKGVNYADYVRSLIECEQGEVVDLQGNVVGTHEGVQLYTIGQKRGFDCSFSDARVVAIIANENQLVVSANADDLYSRKLVVRDWRVADFSLFEGDDIYLKVRGLGRNPVGHFKVAKEGNLLAVELLDDKAWAVAPGQPVVFYKGDILTGGGYLL